MGGGGGVGLICGRLIIRCLQADRHDQLEGRALKQLFTVLSKKELVMKGG